MRLTQAAGEADAAQKELAAATQAVRELLGGAPGVLGQDLGTGVDAADAREAWQAWASLAGSGSTGQLVATGQGKFSALAAAVSALQAQAAASAQQRNEVWLPVAAALASWLALAKPSERAAADLAVVRQAIDWLRKAGQEIRDQRMAQLTETSGQVWGMLRLESNVELGQKSAFRRSCAPRIAMSRLAL
jgi:hypothetical protein